MLINKRKGIDLKEYNGSKAFTGHFNDMDDIYENIEEHKPDKECETLIVFHDMIADMLSNKKLNPIITELLIRGRKLNTSLVFIIQSYFAVPKYIRHNSTQYFIMKIPNKQEVQQIAFNHLSDIDLGLMSFYKKFTVKPSSFLVIDVTLVSIFLYVSEKIF